jgi:hypothetical protein
MNTDQESAAELIDKPAAEAEKLIIPEEWSKDFQTINATLATMENWKSMTIEKDGITKVTANRVAAKKLRVRIEDLRKELGRAIMLRKANVDAFADKLKDAVSAVEIALEVIEDAHKAKVRAEREEREREAAKILNDRIAQLESYGYIPADVAAVGKMTAPDFLQLLDDRRKIFEIKVIARLRHGKILAIGPDDISEDVVGHMTDAEFESYLNCHRVSCEVAERERAEAEQAERDRVAKLETELQESRQRIDELERSQTPIPIVNSSGDTIPAQLGEVIDAEFEVIQPGRQIVLEPAHDVQPVIDTVEITLLLQADGSALYAYAENLKLSGDATKILMAQRAFQSVWNLDRHTGVLTLKRFDGHEIDRPF